jgi:hypothetical protein
MIICFLIPFTPVQRLLIFDLSVADETVVTRNRTLFHGFADSSSGKNWPKDRAAGNRGLISPVITQFMDVFSPFLVYLYG